MVGWLAGGMFVPSSGGPGVPTARLAGKMHAWRPTGAPQPLRSGSVMLKLATIIDNPGEPPVETRYRDPHVLRQLGYNGLVIYETTGLSGIDSPQVIKDHDLRHFVQQRMDHVRQTIDAARTANLQVYLSYDLLVLARDVVDQHATALCCRNRQPTLCPASDETLRRCRDALKALLDRLPFVDGVVLRFGDNDAARLPYLVGNDLYSPSCARCAQFGRADRIVRCLEQFHELVVKQLGKRLIVRAWNVRPNGMHDSVELCQRIVERLPGDPTDDRFILSFKFTQTDFWRYQRWNPASLTLGDRPVIYELQCQREFEGKGGIPNWQASLWRDGAPEVAEDDSPEARGGLAHVSDQVHLAGLWAWVRGGGWGGPFVSNESWIDANVYAVPRLADNPHVPAKQLARDWVRDRLHITREEDVAILADVLERSPQLVLQSFYIGPYARSLTQPWHPNADWIQDDLVDAEAAWRIVKRLPDHALDEVLREKDDAVEKVSLDRAAVRNLVDEHNRKTLEPLVHTLMYAESFYAALRDLLAALVAYRRYQQTRDRALAEVCRQRVFDAQMYWNHHVQRYASLPGCATAFREMNFWDLTQRILIEVDAITRQANVAQ